MGLLSELGLAPKEKKGGLIANIADVPELQNSHGGSFMTGLINAIASAITLPRDVYEGKVDPRSEEGIRRANDMAGIVTLGAGAVPAEANSLRAGLKVLPMDEASRLARAKEQGFTLDAYHGGPGSNPYHDDGRGFIEQFRPGENDAIFATNNPDLAGDYAATRYGDRGAVYPLKLKAENPLIVDRLEDATPHKTLVKRAKEEGHDAVILRNADDNVTGASNRGLNDVYIWLDPAKIRSRFAKFDPENISSRDLLAGIAGLGVLGPYLSKSGGSDQ